ncbi:sulfotransferase [Lyngbya sp. CCY1209]|uniref:sulfotransferase n=1 Tax=Lyngbya sp. CCY1209 TaxID=2886103 RepID=UPI002D20F8B6|nr:sulfotransferase [Lyngbya sp. CCY1209]MEB3885580.1 sulfotransferase [Lyngbya sp. CCY1209]
MTASNWVEILEVVRTPASDCEGLVEFCIDRPQGGSRVNAAEVEMAGWVLGKNAPAIAVEVIRGDRILRTISVSDPRPDVAAVYPDRPTAGVCGFKGTVNLGEVSGEEELTLQAVLRDDTALIFGRLRLSDADSPELSEADLPDKLRRAEADLERSRTFLERVKANLERGATTI